MWIGQHVLAAASNDIIQLLPLVDGIPPLRGRPGRSRRKPALVQGDRGYDSQPYRDVLHRRGIKTQLAKRRTPHGSGSAARAGSSNAHWRGCIDFAVSTCATNAVPVFTKRF
jgi:hypothetical protein